jgi:hypothetical protein
MTSLQLEGRQVTHPDVFVSYSTSDIAAIQKIVRDVRHLGYTVWIDHERIAPGEPFLSAIHAGMEACACILVAISDSFLKSDWCQEELTGAITDQVARGKRVLPVLLDAAGVARLPSILRSRRAIGVTELARSLRRLLGLPRFWSPEIGRDVPGSLKYFQQPGLRGLKPREVIFRAAMPLGLFIDSSRKVDLESLTETLSQVGAQGGSFLILGEAGIGKTTTVNYLATTLRARLLAADAPQVVPQLVRLGERATDDVAQALDTAIHEEMLRAAEETGYPILLILDGLNEVSPELFDRVLRTIVIAGSHRSLRLLVTSRPTPLVGRLLGLGSVEFEALRIERWTSEKVERYFDERGLTGLYAVLSPDVADALRLPLLASLLIRRVEDTHARPSLRTVTDVFEYVVTEAVRQIDVEARGVLASGPARYADSRAALEDLALSMTKDNAVMVPGSVLIQSLGLGEKAGRVVEAMIQSGLLRSVDPVAHLSTPLRLEELESIGFSFVHQAVQEFLTASAIRSRSPRHKEWIEHLPEDVSQDAYFREIPLYLIQLLDSASERLGVADQFRAAGDWLTAARLAKVLGDPAMSHELEVNIASDVIASIGQPSFYPQTRETLRVLGVRAIRDLVEFVDRPGLLEEIYSEPEARIFRLPLSGADEVTWRVVGRSIVFLSEMGNAEWLDSVRMRLRNVTSPHLVYHVGESLTPLAEGRLEPELLHEVVNELRSCPLADAVSNGYAAGAIAALGDQTFTDEVIAKLQDRLLELSSAGRTHYVDEFWQRAHGVDALGMVADVTACVRTITTVIDGELESIKKGVHQAELHTPVLSSAIRSVMRCCNRFAGTAPEWRGLLEQFFVTTDLGSNPWVMGFTRQLLISHFHSTEDLEWLKSWRGSTAVAPGIRKMITDALWYAGR